MDDVCRVAKFCQAGYGEIANLLSVTYPASDWNVASLKYDYDQNKCLQMVTAVLQDGTETVLREYTYDNYGAVAEIKDYRALSSTGTQVNDPA